MMKPGGYFYRESAAPQNSKLGGAGVPCRRRRIFGAIDIDNRRRRAWPVAHDIPILPVWCR